jgi:2,3-dihydroxy-p-cumate/2,3-dihydroxybenzoate 3,4-dioxygenase
MTAPFRYRGLGYAALNVTNLDRSVAFYHGLLGLDLVSQDAEMACFRCSRDHHNIVLYAAPEAGLKRVAFRVESGKDLDAAFAHFERSGFHPEWVSSEETARLKQGASFRVREKHSGLLFEYFSAITQMATPFAARLTAIERVGHVVIGSADFKGTRNALLNDFNFLVSDYVEDRFAFLRGFPNPLHHTLAVGAAAKTHLHHINFMVTDIDDVGRALHRMNKNNVKIVFGPGRHPPSGSVFLYFLDPDGMTLEYSFGMEEFPEINPREARMLEPVPAAMDTWGAIPDPLFAVNGQIEVAHGR